MIYNFSLLFPPDFIILKLFFPLIFLYDFIIFLCDFSALLQGYPRPSCAPQPFLGAGSPWECIPWMQEWCSPHPIPSRPAGMSPKPIQIWKIWISASLRSGKIPWEEFWHLPAAPALLPSHLGEFQAWGAPGMGSHMAEPSSAWNPWGMHSAPHRREGKITNSPRKTPKLEGPVGNHCWRCHRGKTQLGGWEAKGKCDFNEWAEAGEARCGWERPSSTSWL